jgi:alanine racemase
MVQNSSRIELSQSALRTNLTFIRSRIGDHPTLAMVVKANAYGHGTECIVPMAKRCGVNVFAVASASEAAAVLEAGGANTQIVIMGILHDTDLT